MSKIDPRDRLIEVAIYYTENETTIRETAKRFGLSKTTIHHYLRKIRNPAIKIRVEELIEKNKNERSSRGGEATKTKFEKIRNGNP